MAKRIHIQTVKCPGKILAVLLQFVRAYDPVCNEVKIFRDFGVSVNVFALFVVNFGKQGGELFPLLFPQVDKMADVLSKLLHEKPLFVYV
jgi:hypothetical protein